MFPIFMVRGLLLACLIAAAPSGASAADEIGLSKDGSSWSTTLAVPLFDPDFRWVPGDDESTSFFVRNQGPSGAQLKISAQSADTDQLLRNEDIALFARADGGPWLELQNGVATAELTDGAIERSGMARVDVRVRFNPASTNPSQNRSLSLTFVVTLTDAAVGNVDNDNDDGDGDDSSGGDDDDSGGRNEDDGLPGAGSSISPQTLWIAAVLIGAGLALVRRARREERADV
jgi:hypothetical protein